MPAGAGKIGEAALRLCKGTKTIRTKAANFELKCIDGTINPYLVVGILIAAAMEGLDQKAALPEPIQINPADLSRDELSKKRHSAIKPQPESSHRSTRKVGLRENRLG